MKKLWLWKNFVDGRPEYWACDNPYPCKPGGGDPLTLGEPCGYAIFKESTQGRFDVSEEQVLAAIKRASVPSETERTDPGTLKMMTALVERAYGIFTASGVLRVAEQDTNSNDPIVAWASDVRTILYRSKPAEIDTALRAITGEKP